MFIVTVIHLNRINYFTNRSRQCTTTPWSIIISINQVPRHFLLYSTECLRTTRNVCWRFSKRDSTASPLWMSNKYAGISFKRRWLHNQKHVQKIASDIAICNDFQWGCYKYWYKCIIPSKLLHPTSILYCMYSHQKNSFKYNFAFMYSR